MKSQLVLATNSEKKRRELRPLLACLDIELILPGPSFAPEETGATFSDNARIKAQAALSITGLPALADDSGLEVAALGGAPGVTSARYGAPQAKSDADRNRLLLRAMESEENREARFVCCLTCLFPDGRCLEVEGVCRGILLRRARGRAGFGYDPLFFLPEQNKSMAELTLEEKNTLSHRARAIQHFLALWRGL